MTGRKSTGVTDRVTVITKKSTAFFTFFKHTLPPTNQLAIYSIIPKKESVVNEDSKKSDKNINLFSDTLLIFKKLKDIIDGFRVLLDVAERLVKMVVSRVQIRRVQ